MHIFNDVKKKVLCENAIAKLFLPLILINCLSQGTITALYFTLKALFLLTTKCLYLSCVCWIDMFTVFVCLFIEVFIYSVSHFYVAFHHLSLMPKLRPAIVVLYKLH